MHDVKSFIIPVTGRSPTGCTMLGLILAEIFVARDILVGG
jgi:hypothetical protein